MALKRLDVWVDSKSAAKILGVNYETLKKAVKRAERNGKKFCNIKPNILGFSYIDGVGRGGKVLQIWIDDLPTIRSGANSVSTNENVISSSKNSLETNLPTLWCRAELGQANKVLEESKKYKTKQERGQGQVEKKEVVAYASLHGARATSKAFNVPINTVYRWIKSFKQKGAKGLKDKRGAKIQADLEKIKFAIYAGGSMCGVSWWEIYCRFWAEENGLVYDELNPSSDISRATFLRHARRLSEEDKSVREYLSKGLDGLSVRPTAIRDYLARNEEWQIDATSIDFMALDEKNLPRRYTAIAMIDVGTSRRVWELAESPNSYANVRLLKKALLKMGRPERIKGDNGKDYVGGHFQGALDRLGISYIKAQPFRGDQKGKIERNFGVIQRKLEVVPGFLGHNVGQRNQRENQAVHKSERLSGAKTNIKNLLTKEQLGLYIDDLLEKLYFVGEESITCEFDLRVLGRSVERKLHANGFSINGVYYLSLDVFRKAQIGESLELIQDIDDLSVYHVYKDGEYLSDVYNHEVVNYTAEEWKAVQKEYTATHVKAKKALVKLAQKTKDELLKKEAVELEQTRAEVSKKERKNLAKKPDEIKSEPKDDKPQKPYRPAFVNIDEEIA